MKPLGEWIQDAYSAYYGIKRQVLVVGPLKATVTEHQDEWYIDVGEIYDSYFSFGTQSQKINIFKTEVDAKLKAEEELSKLIGEAVREGSRLGLYGKKKVIRDLRKNKK